MSDKKCIRFTVNLGKLQDKNITKIWIFLFFLHELWTYFNEKTSLKKQGSTYKILVIKCLEYIFLHRLIQFTLVFIFTWSGTV